MGLDELHLRVLATSSEDLTQKRNAQKGLYEIIDFLKYSYSLISGNSIEANAEGKTLGPSGTSLPLIPFTHVQVFFTKVLLLGNVVSMCILDC